MADLRLDQSRAFAGTMLQLHAEFRHRHGLPPLPSSWTLSDHLAALRTRAALSDPALLRSHTRIGNRLLSAVRQLLWDVLKPIFFRQTAVNQDVVLALEALARDRVERRHSQHVLSERITALEAEVDRLRARGE
jgi:hypothetical protein